MHIVRFALLLSLLLFLSVISAVFNFYPALGPQGC